MRQAQAVAQILKTTVEAARIMARNAQLERELHATGECNAPAYDLSAEGRRFETLIECAEEIEKGLSILTLAAGFDPKRPLTAGSPA